MNLAQALRFDEEGAHRLASQDVSGSVLALEALRPPIHAQVAYQTTRSTGIAPAHRNPLGHASRAEREGTLAARMVKGLQELGRKVSFIELASHIDC